MDTAIIGQRVCRLEGRDKATGAAEYPADLKMEGLLYGRALRSAYPHARIVAIDTSKAKDLPGVHAVLTAADISGPNEYGLIIRDQSVLAREKVRYLGDAVAVVAATSPTIAERAIGLIDVHYEELPAVFDPLEAMKPEAPQIHDKGNILHQVHLQRGDVATGFAQADLIVESTYRTPFAEHAYLQPEAGLATIDETGKVTVYVATQWTHEDRRQITHALGLSLEQVRVVQMTVGGAFGGREDISVQILLALLALKTGRPVKMVYSRAESILAHTKRHPFHMRYKTGATKDGRLMAMEIELIADVGAYASTSPIVLTTAVTLATGPYCVENVKVDGYAVYTNNPVTAAMRGFGSNQPAFASEQQMSKLAEKLGMDPVELRHKNLYTDGAIMHTGQVLQGGVGARETLEKAVALAKEQGLWDPPRSQRRALSADIPEHGGSAPPKRRGVGLACGFKNVGYNLGFRDKAGAVIELYSDGAVVKVGTAEVGQGSTTILAQIAATELGLPLERIQRVVGDTDITPDSGSSSASRQTFLSGGAVRQAAVEVRQQLLQRAAGMLEAAVDDLEISAGLVYIRGSPAQSLSFSDVVARVPSPEEGGEPMLKAEVVWEAPPTTPLDPTGVSSTPNFTYGYGAQIVEVEVEVDTGRVNLQRVVAAHDVGKAINPTNVEGQIEGGVVMSQGYALLEEFVLENGVTRTNSLATYLIPTAMDAPREILPVIVEYPDPYGPYGVKGVGEMTMLPTPAAITAAIHDAIGVWIDELPVTPERVLKTLGRL